MCTVVVAFYPQSRTPLIIAANRDESPNRPSKDWEERSFWDMPAVKMGPTVTVYSPLDVLNGTWIGCNDHGIFAAITNWDLPQGTGLHNMTSRGLIVLETLKKTSLYDVLDYWDDLNPKLYKPFNLFAGKEKALFHLFCDNNIIAYNQLQAGLHTSTGAGFGALEKREVFIKNELRKRFCNFSRPVDSVILQKLMSAHNEGLGSEDSVCVHDQEHRWETVSNSMLILNQEYWTVQSVNKPPCQAEETEYKIHVMRNQ